MDVHNSSIQDFVLSKVVYYFYLKWHDKPNYC